MKRTLALLLALLMALSLCACGGNSDEIELTLDNYETYLKVDTFLSGDGESVLMPALFADSSGSHIVRHYPSARVCSTMSGSSTNFNYNDVKVVVHVTGNWTYRASIGDATLKDMEVDLTLEVTGDITGSGNKEATLSFAGSGLSYTELADCDIEVVEVSGTLTPA